MGRLKRDPTKDRLCKICGDVCTTRAGLKCYKCIYKNRLIKYPVTAQKTYDERYYNKQKEIKENRPACLLWVAKQIDRKCMVDLKGLCELIDIYRLMGGKDSLLEEFNVHTGKNIMSVSQQFEFMWKYCYNEFIKEYPKLDKINIL